MKLRRQARERRQYVYAKSLEAQERLTYERKQQLKNALASGKALPTELRKPARELGKDLAFDEAQAGWVCLLHFCVRNPTKSECRTNNTHR
jgi:U3 small nucleolar ribonucleoprotein protein IMP4